MSIGESNEDNDTLHEGGSGLAPVPEDAGWNCRLRLADGPARGMSQKPKTKLSRPRNITFGDLKYPADYSNFDFVNPEAPKGGEISSWGFGTFDSFNPTRQGRSGRILDDHV